MRTERRRKAYRRAIVVLATIAGSVAAIAIAARRNRAREHAARHPLGDLLYRETRGAGTPIVFLAGLQGSTRYWPSAVHGLAASHRLIFVDALGFGRSPWPPNLAYDLDDQVGALRRTLIAENATEHVRLVAHSFGTIIAASYAARFSSEVDRVVLLGTPVFADEQQARERIRGMSSVAALFTFNRPLAYVSCLLMCAFRPFLERVLPSLRPDLDPAVVSDVVLHDLPAIDGAVNRILLHEPVERLLRVIGSKTVLIHGARDTMTPLAEVAALAQRIGAELVTVEGTHHDYLSDGIDTVRRAIERPTALDQT